MTKDNKIANRRTILGLRRATAEIGKLRIRPKLKDLRGLAGPRSD